MAMLYCRRKRFVGSCGRVFDHLCVDSSRVCSSASFELVGGVAEFLIRVRGAPPKNSANTSAISFLSYLWVPTFSCMCVMRTSLRLVLMDG